MRGFCDLPLTFNRSGLGISGHSSDFPWLSSDHGFAHNLRHIDRVHELISLGPRVIQNTLNSVETSADWEKRLQAAARAIHAGFQATSAGQLIANMVSAAEVLVARRNSKEKWWERASRLKVLVGPTYWTRVEEILSARHAYVHEAKQPASPYIASGAIGLSVHVWKVLHVMGERLQSLDSILDQLDSLILKNPQVKRAKTNDLLETDIESLNHLYHDIPRGPLHRIHWIDQGLTACQPDKYYLRHSIFGTAICRQCRTTVTQEHLAERTNLSETYVCPKCGTRTEALLPFARDR